MDKYDRAVKYLTKHPDKIYTAWSAPFQYRGGCLFDFCGPVAKGCGCLTQVRGGDRAVTKPLTKRIAADTRIPDFSHGITVASLPVFAEWQRELDTYAFRINKVNGDGKVTR